MASAASIRETFAVFDKDGSGTLTVDKLVGVFRDIAQLPDTGKTVTEGAVDHDYEEYVWEVLKGMKVETEE